MTVQRELPWRTAVEIAYVGTEGHDLQTTGESGLNLNQLDPQYMSLGSQLNQQVANPFFGIVNNGVLASPGFDLWLAGEPLEGLGVAGDPAPPGQRALNTPRKTKV